MSQTIIKGKYVLLSVSDGLRFDWGLVVENDRIIFLGPNAEIKNRFPGATIVDVGNKLIAPGFVNGHMHMYGVLSHGIPVRIPPGGFESFLDDFWWPQVENKLNHDLVAKTTANACMEMIKSGVTSFCDILEGPNSIPGALKVAAGVVEQVGLRGFLSFEACQRVSERNAGLGLEENVEFIKWAREHSNLLRGLISIHTTFTCSEKFIKEAFLQAKELEAPFHMHLSESRYEPDYCQRKLETTPLKLYDSLKCLDDSVLASQGVQLTTGEIELFAQRGSRLVHMPLSNCEVGGGVAPIPDLLQKGVIVGLGSDGYINNFFEVMRGAFLIHKAYRQDTQVMPARTVYEMATAMGARALGYEDLGKLTAGSLADLITIDVSWPTPLTWENVFDQIVLFRSQQHVEDVMVNGRWLMRDKELLTIDEAKTLEETKQAAKVLWEGI